MPYVLDDVVTEEVAITAYQWIQSWFWDIESEAEYLGSCRTEANKDMITAIRNFVVQGLIPVKCQWLRCYFLYTRSLDAKANSIVDSQNSSLKHGTVQVTSNLGIDCATQRMTDYAKLIHHRKSVNEASAVASTLLWSASGTVGWLTGYAEGLICSNMYRRLCYLVVQGMFFVIFLSIFFLALCFNIFCFLLPS